MAIVTYPLNGITYGAEDAETYLCTRTSGVYADEDCFDLTISDGMTIKISPGIAWVRNADYTGKSICMDTAQTLTLSIGDSKPRTDRIVLRFDQANNESVLDILEGTPSSDYPAPDVTQEESTYELGLYSIYVDAAATSLSASDITDTRLDEDVCGLMSDGVTKIPTATLQAQAEELLSDLKTALEEAEESSAFMMAAVYDPAGGVRQVAFSDELEEVANIANQNAEDISALSNTVSDISDDVDALANDVSNTASELNTLSNTVSNVTSDMESLANDVSNVASDLETLTESTITDSAHTTNDASVVVGTNSTASVGQCTVVGYNASASNGGVAIGYLATAYSYGIAIGRQCYCYDTNSIAIGNGCTVSSSNCGQFGGALIQKIALGGSNVTSLTCAVDLTVSSDIRDKTDIVAIDNGATEFLEQIKPILYVKNDRERYVDAEKALTKAYSEMAKYGVYGYDEEEYAACTKKDTYVHAGVSAQNVQKALANVYGNSEGYGIVDDSFSKYDAAEIPDGVENKLTVAYSEFIPYLIKSVQELASRITALEEVSCLST